MINGRHIAVVLALAGVGISITPTIAQDPAPNSAALSASLRTRYRALSDRRGSALAAYRRRLALIDQIETLILESFRASKTASLSTMLGEVDPSLANAAGDPSRTPGLSASEIISQFHPVLAQGLASPALTPDELGLLREHYTAYVRTAQLRITRRGRVVAAISEAGRIDVLELCMVLPFLHTPDGAWSRQDVLDLPEWTRRGHARDTLESFALRRQRPRTAYAWATLGDTGGPGHAVNRLYRDYLQQAADVLLNQREFHAAIYCLRSAVPLAIEADDGTLTDKLRLKLTEVYAGAGHPKLAAQSVAAVYRDSKDPQTRGRAAVLHLKHLFEAEQFDAINERAAVYRDDPACRPYEPQILYIHWVSSRRTGETDRTDRLEATFLKRYPRHPLAADIYFARAMSDLAAAEYSQAYKQLEIVRYRFPDSRLAKKAAQLQDRLEQTVTSAAVAESPR